MFKIRILKLSLGFYFLFQIVRIKELIHYAIGYVGTFHVV